MSFPQFIIAYAVCWWLVLFMLLPHKANPPENPGVGHAPSAPENPRLRAKFKWATVLALIPTAVIYFIATAAGANEGDEIYTTKGGCSTLKPYSAPKDIAADDVTMNKSALLGKSVEMPLEIPSTNYLNPDTHSGDLSESHLNIGKLEIGMDGSALLSGQPISGDGQIPADCEGSHD